MEFGETLVAIIFILAIASVMKAKYTHRDSHPGGHHPHDGEAARLRDEVVKLKDRVAVLERIATDKNHLLEQEIESLRERPRIERSRA